jgi:hypothetical protein
MELALASRAALDCLYGEPCLPGGIAETQIVADE